MNPTGKMMKHWNAKPSAAELAKRIQKNFEGLGV